MSTCHIHKIIIRERHLDSFAHVNNAVYLELFEEARWQVLEDCGWGFQHIHASKFGIAILEVHVRFNREVFLREEVTIETGFEPITGRIGGISQIIRGEDGLVRTSAYFRYGIFDKSARKLVMPNPEWMAVVERYSLAPTQ